MKKCLVIPLYNQLVIRKKALSLEAPHFHEGFSPNPTKTMES